MSASPSTAEIAEALTCFGSDTDRREQELQLAVLRLLAEGEPVDPDRIGERTGLGGPELIAQLERLQGLRTDDAGRIVAYGGLSLVEAPHRLRIRERTLYTWCAWDTLFLPELIGEPAEIESQCPATGEAISLRLGREGPKDLAPPDTVLSFLVPRAGFDDDVIGSFCRFVHFFVSAEVAEEWTAQYPGAFVISVEQGFEIGRLTNARDFGQALHGAATGGRS